MAVRRLTTGSAKGAEKQPFKVRRLKSTKSPIDLAPASLKVWGVAHQRARLLILLAGSYGYEFFPLSSGGRVKRPSREEARRERERLWSEIAARSKAGRRHETLLTAGQTVRGIKKILPVARIMRDLIAEAEAALLQVPKLS
jgi:NAD(P)H-dependent flavin oxidoreductase YrpB (nitropropane dioxygenase family)